MPSEPRYLSLPQLFLGSLFRVPDYQRGYAWTKAQLDDLWADIDLLDARSQHFTGMIVVEKRRDRYHDVEMQPYRELEVIDGQQRLTTVVLVMHAVIRELRALGGEAAEQAERLHRIYIGSPGWRALSLNDDSRAYFEHLLGEGEPLVNTENGSQRNLLNAVRYFRGRIDTFGTGEARLQGLRQLVAKLQANLRFVFYEVDDDAEAGLIFEVMNNRGRELSEADRLKNYLMYLAYKVGLPDESVKGIASQWGEVFKQVMRASPDGVASVEGENRLLRNHWILYREAEAPKDLRGMSISQRVRHDMLLKPVPPAAEKQRNEGLGGAAQNYVGSLVTTSHDYAEVMNPSAPGSLTWVSDGALLEKLRWELLSFHRMGQLATALPLLLAGRRRLMQEPALYLELARALSIYAFRVYVICGRRSNAGQAHFRGHARALFGAGAGKLVDTCRGITADVYGWTRGYGGDAEFERALRHGDFYRQHGAQDIRYLFYELEVDECHGQQPALDWAAFANTRTTQVEHIWAQAVPWLGDTKAAHEANVNRLGNLTVTHFNQTLGAKAFGDKRSIYAKSNLLIEHGLQHHRLWSLNKVAERERQLVEFALRRWALPALPPA
jgi:hypothetical protein